MGMKVEIRPVPVEELESFEEVGACGTAAVITPVRSIVDESTGKSYDYCRNGQPGPVSVKLYEQLQGIQTGDLPDPYGWIEFVD
jgi:branched-chain amino acid aminotransferase